MTVDDVAMLGGLSAIGYLYIKRQDEIDKFNVPTSTVDDIALSNNVHSNQRHIENRGLFWYGTDGAWRDWVLNAMEWFISMGLIKKNLAIGPAQGSKSFVLTELSKWPDVYYHCAHGCYKGTQVGTASGTCWDHNSMTTPECIDVWIRASEYREILPENNAIQKGKIAFIGSCDAMGIGNKQSSYGNIINVFSKHYDVVIGWKNVADSDDTKNAWLKYSKTFQDLALYLFSSGLTIKEAFDVASETITDNIGIGNSYPNYTPKHLGFMANKSLNGPRMKGLYDIVGDTNITLLEMLQ